MPRAAGRNRVLQWAFAVSLALHGAALAVRFVDPELLQVRNAELPLDVVLVNARSAERPVAPQALAQVNLEGGGRQDEGMRSSPLPNSFDLQDGDVLQAAQRTVRQLEEEQRQLLAAFRAARAEPSVATAPEAGAPAPEPARRQLMRMQAQIAKEISDYQKRPRVGFYVPSTAESRFARYVEEWRARIERVGNEHYPEEARGRLYGSLRMTAVIGRDGSLIDAMIDRSSGSPVLDLAARRIVKLAAPFPPFPPDMARDTDVYVITRTWIFTNDQLAMRGEGAQVH